MNTSIKQNTYRQDSEISRDREALSILLDLSGSMDNEPLEQLKWAYNQFIKTCACDDKALNRVDIQIIGFSGKGIINLTNGFLPLKELVRKPDLNFTAYGSTPMGKAAKTAMKSGIDKLRRYEALGTPHHKHYVILISDGKPTDNINNAVRMAKKLSKKGTLRFISVAVNGADKETLRRFSDEVKDAKSENNFEGIFKWVTDTITLTLNSSPFENPVLPEIMDSIVKSRVGTVTDADFYKQTSAMIPNRITDKS